MSFTKNYYKHFIKSFHDFTKNFVMSDEYFEATHCFLTWLLSFACFAVLWKYTKEKNYEIHFLMLKLHEILLLHPVLTSLWQTVHSVWKFSRVHCPPPLKTGLIWSTCQKWPSVGFRIISFNWNKIGSVAVIYVLEMSHILIYFSSNMLFVAFSQINLLCASEIIIVPGE